MIEAVLKSKNRYWVTFVGDSITSAEWVHPNWREIVEYVLKTELTNQGVDWKLASWGVRCFNWGLDGSTSKDVVENFDKITEPKPDLMILLTGANDPPLQITVDEHRENLEKIIKSAREKKIELVVATDNNPANKDASTKYLPYIEADRKLLGNDLIDLYGESANFPTERTYTFLSEADIPEENIKKGDRDFWHPNQLGNAYIAMVILDRVFGINFDPEKYIDSNSKGAKCPEY